MKPYSIQKNISVQRPILISVPHAGKLFPQEILPLLKPKWILSQPDCDLAVDELYAFAPELGASVLKAEFSRYVVDLNRDPENLPLYQDKRILTPVVPTQTFSQEALYTKNPSEKECKERLKKYFWPYHEEIRSQITTLKKKFKHILILDAHSIERRVPSIRERPFPCLMLGNNQNQSCHEKLTLVALDVLKKSDYTVSINDPFYGGYITRHYANPKEGIHTLQLEMSKDIYLSQNNSVMDTEKSQKLHIVLKDLLKNLLKTLESLP